MCVLKNIYYFIQATAVTHPFITFLFTVDQSRCHSILQSQSLILLLNNVWTNVKINLQIYHVTVYSLSSLSLYLVNCCWEQKLKYVVAAVSVFVVSFCITICIIRNFLQIISGGIILRWHHCISVPLNIAAYLAGTARYAAMLNMLWHLTCVLCGFEEYLKAIIRRYVLPVQT